MVLGHVNVHVGTREELDGRKCLWMDQKVFQPAVSVVAERTMGWRVNSRSGSLGWRHHMPMVVIHMWPAGDHDP
jgi:hypothetical protein